jgi:hypothetical protein
MTVKVEDKRLFGPDGTPFHTDEPAPSPGAGPLLPAPDFSQLVLSLYASAMMSMGFSPDKGTPPVPRDLGAAKQTIDLLGMLSEKTRGNLSAEEGDLLQESLSTLRLIFVKKWEKR